MGQSMSIISSSTAVVGAVAADARDADRGDLDTIIQIDNMR